VALSEVEPPAAGGHELADVASQHLPEKLLTKKGDPGVYSDEGLFGLGPGWYHIGTADNQLFIGHPGEADFYILDFDVMASGHADKQGRDTISHFERELDGIVTLNTFAEISPGVSYSAMAEGTGPHGQFEEEITYTLAHLEFVAGEAVQSEIARIGQLRFVDFI
jgi:hypothetical protein